MIIREFNLDDYDAVRALWEQYPDALGIGRSDSRAEIAKKIERDPDLFLLAEAEGRIVGTVIGGFDGRRGLIYHLAVDRGWLKQGLGRALMAEVERRLVARGCLRAYLLVRKENLEVVGFYESIGWEQFPILLMAKTLQPEP